MADMSTMPEIIGFGGDVNGSYDPALIMGAEIRLGEDDDEAAAIAALDADAKAKLPAGVRYQIRKVRGGPTNYGRGPVVCSRLAWITSREINTVKAAREAPGGWLGYDVVGGKTT